MNGKEITRSIVARTLVCGTVGLGYVGLPLAVEKAKAGFKTIGFDVQADKVDMVNRGENYIGDVVQEDLAALVEAGTLEATCDFSRVAECGFVAICVPTPLDAHQMPDTSYMEASAREIAPYIREGCMVVLESTTYPGTTEELILPILEEGSEMKCGEGFYLGFSPERVDPGNLVYKTLVHTADCKNGCILTGTKVPAILTSRSDSFQTKVNSIALAAVVAAGLDQ